MLPEAEYEGLPDADSDTLSPDVESYNEHIIGGNGGLQTDAPHQEIANQRSTSQHLSIDRENLSRSTNDEPQSNSEEHTSIEMDDYNDDSTMLKRVQTVSGNVSCGNDDLPANVAQESRNQDDRELNLDDISTTPKQTDLSHSDSYSADLWPNDQQTTSQYDSGRASQTGDSDGHPAHCNVSSGVHCLTCPMCHGQVRAHRQAPSGHHDGSHNRVCICQNTYTHLQAHTLTHVHTVKVIILVPMCNRIDQIR